MSSYSLDTQERPGKMDDRKTTNEENALVLRVINNRGMLYSCIFITGIKHFYFVIIF